MSSLTAVVEDVTAKPTSKGSVYTVVAGGKKFTTFKIEIAEQAKAAKGQKAVIDFTEQQKGEFTNRYVNSVTVEKPTAGFTVEQGKDEQIARAVALKAGVDFVRGEGATVEAVTIAAEFFLAWLTGAPAAPANDPDDDNSIPF